MNIKVSAFSKAMVAVTVFFALSATVIRIILMQTYDEMSGFYTNDILASILNYPLIAFAIISIVMAYIYIKEGKILFSLPQSRTAHIVSLLCACVFGGMIVYNFARLVLPVLDNPSSADLVMTLFAVMAVLYFVSGKSKIGDARALLCSGSALVLLALVFGLYFNPEISYVNHSVVLCFAASIFLMLATVAEANAILKRPCLRRYLAYAPTAIVLSFSLSIPDIIYAVTNASAPLTDIYYDFIILAMGIYHLAKLITVALEKPIEEEN
ncbi:MAG: hypothetical protein IJN48_02945 [Clostridia bacterium]|nr:hypothetical protein [Clostridia bacterium]